MRITIVLGPFLPVPTARGGAVEKVHLQLAGAYRAAGHDVTIVSRQFGDLPHDETIDGIRHVRIASFDGTSSLALNIILTLRYALRVARNLPSADITVTNVFALPLFLPRRRAGKIYVHVARFPKHQMWLYGRADRLQAISHAVADAVAQQAPGLADRVVTIGYPVPDVFFRPAATPRRKTILYVGRIAREKGVHLLIDAFARLAPETPGWSLRIVGPHEPIQGGDGTDYLDELRTAARPLGPACMFAGPVFDQDALLAEYRAASIFAYPSIAEHGEALGLAALEAMATGCATVASDLRCFDDFIAAGVGGLRFDHRAADPAKELAAALARLMRDPVELERIATAGRGAARRFETRAIASRMLDDFASVLSGQSTVRQARIPAPP
jgi:glycosyltransferase involved in cell wall biosynthesis